MITHFRVFKRFREVRPDLVPKQMKKNEPVTVRIPLEDSVEKIPEINVRIYSLIFIEQCFVVFEKLLP